MPGAEASRGAALGDAARCCRAGGAMAHVAARYARRIAREAARGAAHIPGARHVRRRRGVGRIGIGRIFGTGLAIGAVVVRTRIGARGGCAGEAGNGEARHDGGAEEGQRVASGEIGHALQHVGGPALAQAPRHAVDRAGCVVHDRGELRVRVLEFGSGAVHGAGNALRLLHAEALALLDSTFGALLDGLHDALSLLLHRLRGGGGFLLHRAGSLARRGARFGGRGAEVLLGCLDGAPRLGRGRGDRRRFGRRIDRIAHGAAPCGAGVTESTTTTPPCRSWGRAKRGVMR